MRSKNRERSDSKNKGFLLGLTFLEAKALSVQLRAVRRPTRTADCSGLVRKG